MGCKNRFFQAFVEMDLDKVNATLAIEIVADLGRGNSTYRDEPPGH